MKKTLALWLIVGALVLASCSTTDRYNAIASSCQLYAAALRTAAVMNQQKKLSVDTIKEIDATVAPAQAVCTGPAPSTDPAAVQKVTDLVLVVLKAQGDLK